MILARAGCSRTRCSTNINTAGKGPRHAFGRLQRGWFLGDASGRLLQVLLGLHHRLLWGKALRAENRRHATKLTALCGRKLVELVRCGLNARKFKPESAHDVRVSYHQAHDLPRSAARADSSSSLAFLRFPRPPARLSRFLSSSLLGLFLLLFRCGCGGQCGRRAWCSVGVGSAVQQQEL